MKFSFKGLFRTIFRESDGEDAGTKNITLYGSIFFALVSVILTCMNVSRQYWFMAGTTGTLILGFTAAALLAAGRRLNASRIIMAVMCGAFFSVYAITGENEGFAILWILLVPVLGMNLVGLKIGFLLSVYFQVFLIALFYTPLAEFVRTFYTATFVSRFPILYFASFGACTVMMSEKQSLYRRVHRQAYQDGLTGLYNRSYYNEFIPKAEKLPLLTVVAMDLNGLKYTNDTKGHEAGDRLIRESGQKILEAFPDATCFRIGGDEFTVLCSSEDAVSRIDRFKAACPEISVGYATRIGHPELSFNELSRQADGMMYTDKANYYREHGCARGIAAN